MLIYASAITALPFQHPQDTPSKKRVVEPAVYVCVSLVARGVEGALRADVKELLEPMMASGLSPPLTVALQELATEIPQLKVGYNG